MTEGLYRDPERHVQLAPCGHPDQRIVTAMIRCGWVPSCRTYLWPMETQNMPGLVLFIGGRFWH
jgi:hypothetical protein